MSRSSITSISELLRTPAGDARADPDLRGRQSARSAPGHRDRRRQTCVSRAVVIGTPDLGVPESRVLGPITALIAETPGSGERHNLDDVALRTDRLAHRRRRAPCHLADVGGNALATRIFETGEAEQRDRRALRRCFRRQQRRADRDGTISPTCCPRPRSTTPMPTTMISTRPGASSTRSAMRCRSGGLHRQPSGKTQHGARPVRQQLRRRRCGSRSS